MAQLIQIRQRIKAIETIKKITHAMRLISMSAHSHLKKNDAPLAIYTNTLHKLLDNVTQCVPQWQNTVLYPLPTATPKTLIILVGSSKGLCGDFNSSLFRFFNRWQEQQPPINPSYIIIGKKAIDHAKLTNITPLAVMPQITLQSLSSLSTTIMHEILKTDGQYTQVILVGNKMKSFFTRKPQANTLIPFTTAETSTPNHAMPEYMWEQDPATILDALAYQALEATIYQLLFQSLLSEQAARFLSMDSSTRNAETILEETRLLYNKLRQTKITTELSELTGTI